MALKAIYTSLEDIDEPYRDLYSERDGKFEITGIEGIKTQADVDRVHSSLVKERDEHKATRERLKLWGELEPEETLQKLDRIPELEAAAKGKLDDAQIDEIVAKRVEGTISSRTAPLERQAKKLSEELNALTAERDALVKERTDRTIRDAVREALVEQKVLPEAHEDALLLAERIFEVREDDGEVVTRDNVGQTPGLRAGDWLRDFAEKRPHWWPQSAGGGAKGGRSGGGGGGNNPWSKNTWNVTEQGKFLREHGRERADMLAKAAGSYVGATSPPREAA